MRRLRQADMDRSPERQSNGLMLNRDRQSDAALLVRLAEECRRLAALCDQRGVKTELFRLSADMEHTALKAIGELHSPNFS